jgi:hypothetical protein
MSVMLMDFFIFFSGAHKHYSFKAYYFRPTGQTAKQNSFLECQGSLYFDISDF